MSVTSDICEMVFASKGVSQVIADYQRLENAEIRIQRLQARAAGVQVSPQMRAQQQVQDAIRNQEQRAVRQAAQEAVTSAELAVGVLKREYELVRSMTEAYVEYGREIQSVRSLTGASVRESEQFVNVARVAGLDAREMTKELAHVAEATRSGEGRAALSQIGVMPIEGESTVQLFGKISEALSRIPDGTRKATLEMQIFSARGLEGLQPLLNMAGDVRKRTLALRADLDGRAVNAITHFQQSSALLGQTVLVDVAYPIIEKLLPAFDSVVNVIQETITAYHALDKQFGGLLSWAVVVGGIATAFLSAVAAVAAFSKAIEALMAVEKVQIVVQAVMDALQGPKGWASIAAAVAIGGAAYIGVNSINNGGQGADSAKDVKGAATYFKNAATEFGRAVGQFKQWGAVAGSQAPPGITEADYAFLAQQNALGAIG